MKVDLKNVWNANIRGMGCHMSCIWILFLNNV